MTLKAKQRVGIVAGIVILALMLEGAWWLKSARGFSARASPTWMETEMARMARAMALPRASGEMKDPLPVTTANITMAAQHFAAHCALCHNNNGDGLTELGRNFYPKPPDLAGGTQSKTDGEIFYVIRNGVRLSAMPAWPDDEDSEIWMLVQFIRQLPHQTPAQVTMMKTYNPKTNFSEPIM